MCVSNEKIQPEKRVLKLSGSTKKVYGFYLPFHTHINHFDVMKLWRWLTTKQIHTHLIADESKIFFYGIKAETRAEIKGWILRLNFCCPKIKFWENMVLMLLFCHLVYIDKWHNIDKHVLLKSLEFACKQMELYTYWYC